jgi:hypothetical protein
MSTLALILGIIGLIGGGLGFWMGWFSYIGFVASILAIILGAIALRNAKNHGNRDGKAKTGMVLGIISVALSIAAFIVGVILAAAIINNIPKPS